MKIIYVPLFISVSLASCSPKVQLKKQVDYQYVNAKFDPGSGELFRENGLSVKVSPIDAASINKLALKMSTLGGDYERELYNSTDFVEKEGLTASQRVFLEAKVNSTKFLNRLVGEERISYKVGRNFFERITKESGMNGSEVVALSQRNDHGSDFNPYYIKGYYLSVFELVIENSSHTPKVLYRDDFAVTNGLLQLSPFSESDLTQESLSDFQSFLNLRRMNIPDSILIAPSSKIVKYFAIPGLDISSGSVQVRYFAPGKTGSVEFAIKPERVAKKYDLRYYTLNMSKKLSSTPLKYYFVVEFEEGRSFALKGQGLYLEERYGGKFKVHVMGISLNGKEVYYSVTPPITTPQGKSKTIALNFSKALRYP